jgi:hypothetical protein
VTPPTATGQELAGLAEAAEILGVSKQRVTELRAQPAFPAPVAELKSGPVWTRDSIEEFAQTRRRQPGRPAAEALAASAAQLLTQSDTWKKLSEAAEEVIRSSNIEQAIAQLRIPTIPPELLENEQRIASGISTAVSDAVRPLADQIAATINKLARNAADLSDPAAPGAETPSTADPPESECPDL